MQALTLELIMRAVLGISDERTRTRLRDISTTRSTTRGGR
jgi:hypothetical protein